MREKHREQKESKGICYEALEEFAREKIREHLQYLLEEEVTEWLGREKSERKGNAVEQPGYRNGYGKRRRFTLSTGTVEIRRPRVRDLGERFVSKVLPFFKRQTKQVRDLIPELYLHGLASGDFELALRGLCAGTEWLNDELIRRVHFDMFGEIWEWAGKYRTDSVNIGVDFHLIPEQIKLLCGDFNYWNSDKGAMPPLQIAARLQNRLTRIHPFINGNGRHARLITDIFFHSVKHPLPKWPQIQLLSEGDQVRSRYIEAMKAADKEDYRELMAFMKEFVE